MQCVELDEECVPSMNPVHTNYTSYIFLIWLIYMQTLNIVSLEANFAEKLFFGTFNFSSNLS